MKYTITILLSLLLISCGSKKVTSNKNVIEDTNAEVLDTSTTVSKIEGEKQYITTDIKERIVTMYSVRFDTIYIEGERIITPIVFPSQTEEFRDMSTSNYVWKLKTQDSIQNAIELRYNNKLIENEQTIEKLSNQKGAYQLLFILFLICGIIWGIIIFKYR